MTTLSKAQRFEEAAKYRDILEKFDYIRQSFKTAQTFIDNPYLVDDMLAKSLDELVKNISDLKEPPKRIECYDISNISGKEAVGAMTVAIDGRIQNSEYRKFKIKFKTEPDDFEMMREVLFRRLSHKDWPSPDLLVIDGGKGQLSAVLEVLRILDLQIPIVGLAKKFETIVSKEDGEFKELVLDRRNEGLKLLQRLRDEAHRFGKKYHHQLRLTKLKRL
jgi:excinuclease ABC subunit C